ncbi:MAG TPA: metalloregulator ArsR/SmtB family transcription factor [Albidovulum sp.]|uniref:ArsR/SmtB family transcription factor n=1 Tax=Albidovulum sp. TaxID=1872424 RepID=UPI002D0FCEE1|nr:metalloregulator ArsR/SmtB family transcription factor [Albidovulum sp.]
MTPKFALLEEYALIARALGAPHRMVLLEQLAQGERGVEALADKVGVTVANCSQHLQQLRRAGLVTSRRAGKAVIYRMTDDKTLVLMDLLARIARQNLSVVEEILQGLSGGIAPEPITRADLAERLKDGSVTVLDLRPEDEFAMGHIPGAIQISLSELGTIIEQLDTEAEIVAYCRGPYCVYARQAVAALRQQGLSARCLEGGLPEWREEGRAVQTWAQPESRRPA